MKKIVLTLLITFVYLTANAQERPSLRGYEKWVDIGLTYPIGYGVKFTNGYRFNNHIFLGAGAGLCINMYFHMWSPLIDGGLQLPVYASFRAYFLKGKISPYFHIDSGYTISIGPDFEPFGPFYNPNIGVNFNLGKSWKKSLFFQVGVHGQVRPRYEYIAHKINISLGFRF